MLERLRQAWGEYQRDYAPFHAAAMVYYALVSLVPLVLLLLSSLGLMLRYSASVHAAEKQVLDLVDVRLGAEAAAAISRMLDDLQRQSIVTTVISVIGLLITASMLFRNLRLSFRAIWKLEPPFASSSVRVIVRETLLEQVISFAMVLTAGLVLLLSLAIVATLQWIGGLFGHLPMLGDTAAWTLVVAGPLLAVTAMFAFLFKYLPPVRVEWRHVLLPAVFCAVAWYVTAEAVTLYGRFFDSGVSAYGALGGLLVIILWMNVVCQLLFFGAELCKLAVNPGFTGERRT